ncbi:hypothetical protein UFOVP747_4 [uncultured Caudovirales phage]|uniref:Uncharacterized protein n=1 Tax=uncultured Caudovirales phage TaxID=2100421 RepID=A0A6J7X433_9CAUD|nr:hypothetical protein UFOVP675_26 [uncultured Caudovirales phage]CAB5225298.1 hypothetical protein UFOVP747_4 [uncultured Caudovirales phage]
MPLIRVMREGDSLTLTYRGREAARVVLAKCSSNSARMVLIMPPDTIAQHDAARPDVEPVAHARCREPSS